MTDLSTLKYWIDLAIQQPVDDSLEMFYYDTNNKQFFSVLIIDLYLFDKKLNVLEGISMYYEKEELALLKDRVKRIYNQKRSIISVPKCGIIENNDVKNQIIETFISKHKIDITTSSVLILLQKEPISFPIVTKTKSVTKPWWKIW